MRADIGRSNRDPLHEIPRHLPMSTVVESRRAGVGVAGEVLHVFERGAVLEEVRDHRDTERMGR